MINVSPYIKYKYGVDTTDVNKILLNGSEYPITNVEYIDDTYIDGNIYGTAIARQLTFEVPTCNIEKQEFEYITGVNTLDVFSLGKFITQDVEDSDTKGMIKVTAMDYMLKTNIVYETQLNYSQNVTVYDVLLEACTQAGIVLGTNTFTNYDFVVDSNQFDEGTLIRQVIQAVAQISGCVAKIKSDNHLYLINPKQVSTVSKVLNTSTYYNLDLKRYTHPINTVVLGMKDIEGENVVMQDEQSVLQNGENRIVFNDNPFAYNQEKREALIEPLFNAIKGFDYRSYEIKGQALPYMETLDKVQVVDFEGNTYDSYIFRFNYKSPNGLESTIEAPSITNATINYENIIGSLEISKRAERSIDKQNMVITDVLEEVDGQNSKLTIMQQTINEINSKISDIADVTTSDSTTTGVLLMENINASEPVKLVVHPNGMNISQLIIGVNTIVGSNAILRSRTLRFTNTETDEVFDYILPDNLFYYDNENYDTFTLEYEGQICQVEKKCKLQNGQVVLLDTPVTTSYTFPTINLTTGDYRIELVGYTGYIFARLMASNMYTEQYSTKVETESKIDQKADEILASVTQTLTNYVTGTEMTSAINIAKNEINMNVSEVSTRTTTAQMTADNATSLANNAQSSANSINTNLTTNYFTKSETNSAINQKATEITSSVSETYSTKAETTQAKNEAINTAGTNTDTKLLNYSTTEQMNSAINQKATEINSTVSAVSSRTTTAQNTADTATGLANDAQTSADNALTDIQNTNDAITSINENIDGINETIADLIETTTTYSTKSELQQTADSFEASITQTTETLTTTINGTQSEINEIKNYIHYDIQDTTGTLTLGKTDNPYTLQLTNHELKINENDNTVAYFDEDSMQVTNGVFNTSLAIGNFEFRPETNGSLSFTRRVS